MAGVRISNLPSVTSALLTDLVPMVQGGVTSKETWSQVLQLFQQNFISSSNDVYVAKNGSDAPGVGNGSITSPYLTIEFALSTITTATISNPFTIHVGSGLYNENTLSVKANVNFVGESITSTLVVVANPVTVNAATFNNVDASVLFFSMKINALAGYNFNLSTVLGVNTAAIAFGRSDITGNMSYIGRSTSQDQLALVLNVLHSPVSSSTSQYISLGNENISDVSVTECFSSLIGGQIVGNLDVIGAVNPASITLSLTTPPGGTLTLNGNFVTANIGVSSYKIPTIIGTPTINLINIGDGLSANFVPVNYTPVDSSVTGNLKGIDTALAAAATPPFGVAIGGTGATSFLAQSVPILDGTNPFTSVQLDLGQALVGQGIGVAPMPLLIGEVAFNSISVQTFVTNGVFTYTPNPKTVAVIIDAVGAGGAGGGSVGGVGTVGAGGGGGAGGYSRRALAIADIGVSQTVTVGVAGLGVAGADGGNGGTTTFGLLVQAAGGFGGKFGTSDATFSSGQGGLPGVGTIGDLNGAGTAGFAGLGIGAASAAIGGFGGNSILGGGGLSTNVEGNGNPATGNGGGGAGSSSLTGSFAGGNGADGYVTVTEFLNL